MFCGYAEEENDGWGAPMWHDVLSLSPVPGTQLKRISKQRPSSSRPLGPHAIADHHLKAQRRAMSRSDPSFTRQPLPAPQPTNRSLDVDMMEAAHDRRGWGQRQRQRASGGQLPQTAAQARASAWMQTTATKRNFCSWVDEDMLHDAAQQQAAAAKSYPTMTETGMQTSVEKRAAPQAAGHRNSGAQVAKPPARSAATRSSSGSGRPLPAGVGVQTEPTPPMPASKRVSAERSFHRTTAARTSDKSGAEYAVGWVLDFKTHCLACCRPLLICLLPVVGRQLHMCRIPHWAYTYVSSTSSVQCCPGNVIESLHTYLFEEWFACVPRRPLPVGAAAGGRGASRADLAQREKSEALRYGWQCTRKCTVH